MLSRWTVKRDEITIYAYYLLTLCIAVSHCLLSVEPWDLTMEVLILFNAWRSDIAATNSAL